MKNYLKINDQEFSYIVKKNKRTKKVKLIIRPNNSLVISAPIKIKLKTAEKLILSESDLILKKIIFLKKNRLDFLENKEKALLLIKEKIIKFNKIYKVRINNIKIKNQKTRWGSCSKRGNLNFNYRIINLPEKLIDYIIVHELCHLKELNHSINFWQLVSNTLPNYVELKKDLRKL